MTDIHCSTLPSWPNIAVTPHVDDSFWEMQTGTPIQVEVSEPQAVASQVRQHKVTTTNTAADSVSSRYWCFEIKVHMDKTFAEKSEVCTSSIIIQFLLERGWRFVCYVAHNARICGRVDLSAGNEKTWQQFSSVFNAAGAPFRHKRHWKNAVYWPEDNAALCTTQNEFYITSPYRKMGPWTNLNCTPNGNVPEISSISEKQPDSYYVNTHTQTPDEIVGNTTTTTTTTIITGKKGRCGMCYTCRRPQSKQRCMDPKRIVPTA